MLATPDSAWRGGYQIASNASWCTLGFVAYNETGQKVAITNSHCTDNDFAFDGGYFGQPTRTWTHAREIEDPNPKWCLWWQPPIKIGPIPIVPPLPLPHKCRDADAAVLGVDWEDIGWGQIARTIDRSGCENCAMSVKIDQDNPTISITGVRSYNIANEILHKIGRTTGWTYGAVEQTCEDYLLPWVKVVINCTDVVDYSSDPGDSGSPVFSYDDLRKEAELRGIHFAYLPWPASDGVMSDIRQIEKDLLREDGERFRYVDPGPPTVWIEGPDTVEYWPCKWEAHPKGAKPFTYLWSGILSGAEKEVQGFVTESGWLKVVVRDLMDRPGEDSLYVTLLGPPEPLENGDVGCDLIG